MRNDTDPTLTAVKLKVRDLTEEFIRSRCFEFKPRKFNILMGLKRGYSFSQLAQRFDLTPPRVRQIVLEAMEGIEERKPWPEDPPKIPRDNI